MEVRTEMTPGLKLTRIAAAAIVFTLHLLAGEVSKAQSAEDTLQKARDTYSQMKSYSDTGVVLVEYGISSEDRHTFSTAFNRSPRHFLLDFHKQGGDRYVIWADPDSFHTWWKATGQQTDYPNPNNLPAFSLSGPSTAGVALKIPTLLYGKSPLGAAMLNLHDPVLEGTEQVGNHHCHRISGRAGDTYSASGKEVNIHKTTVWIDGDSFLVRKMLEVWDPLPGQRNRMTTIFEAQQNPALDEVRFKFVHGQK
jgi:outer membrane lipoprotein-sorting protein